jgi:hypothetical protein
VIIPLPNAWHLEVRITVLSDMTLELGPVSLQALAYRRTVTVKTASAKHSE